jgi:hypothetical protein
MPLGGPFLPQATIDVIRQWITAGAQKSATTSSLEASIKAVQQFAVASSSPDNDSIVSQEVRRLVVSFNGEIDSTLLNGTTVIVERTDTSAGGTHSGEAGATIAVSTAVPAGDTSAILITPQTPLGNGTYRVTLHGSLANMSAQALGHDYSFTFTVDALQ